MIAEVDWFPKPGFWTAALSYYLHELQALTAALFYNLHGLQAFHGPALLKWERERNGRGTGRYEVHLPCSISQILQLTLPPLSGCQQKFLPCGSLYLKPTIAFQKAGVFLIWSQSLHFLDTSCDRELGISQGNSLYC